MFRIIRLDDNASYFPFFSSLDYTLKWRIGYFISTIVLPFPSLFESFYPGSAPDNAARVGTEETLQACPSLYSNNIKITVFKNTFKCR